NRLHSIRRQPGDRLGQWITQTGVRGCFRRRRDQADRPGEPAVVSGGRAGSAKNGQDPFYETHSRWRNSLPQDHLARRSGLVLLHFGIGGIFRGGEPALYTNRHRIYPRNGQPGRRHTHDPGASLLKSAPWNAFPRPLPMSPLVSVMNALRNSAARLVFAAACFFCATCPAVAAAPGFLQIEAIEGEAQPKGYKNWIDIQSFAFGTTRSVGSGPGLISGPPQLSAIKITKRIDRASPLLFQSAVKGGPIP